MHQCPEWSGEGAERRSPEAKAAAGEAYRITATLAQRQMISPEDTRTLHRVMFEGRVPLDYYAGNFRQDDPTQPCLAKNVGVAGVPGSSYHLVIQHMALAFAELGTQHGIFEVRWATLPPRQRALRLAQLIAFGVGRFVQIHPFLNGNGRVSRLIWAWGLLRFGLPPQCRVSRRPGPPYEMLMAEAMKGNFAPMAVHVLSAISRVPPALPT
jgi:fido (protein-threonine AMPylation protein)